MNFRIYKEDSLLIIAMDGYKPYIRELKESSLLEISNYLTQPLNARVYDCSSSCGIFSKQASFETEDGQYAEISFPEMMGAFSIHSNSTQKYIVDALNLVAKEFMSQIKFATPKD